MTTMVVWWFWLTLIWSTELVTGRVWGPGLEPHQVMPARYFFVQLPISSSVPNDLLVDISGQYRSESCRISINILNLKDGNFIVRYRLEETCDKLKIIIKHKNKHIGNSPYYFTGPVYHEDCDCPVENFLSWSKDYECPDRIDQVDADMNMFNNVNMTEVYNTVLKKFNSPGSISLCYYAIKNNELYRECFGKHVGFHIFSDAILLSVLRKVTLPDQSFFINLGDWPLVKKNISPVIPIFSWCGSVDTNDIILPTYDLTQSTLENMGRVMLDMLSVQGNIDKKWEEKIPQAFWRGRDSRQERLDLIDIARENPQIYNASLTNFFFFRDKEATYGPKVPHISFFKFFDYKYQINIDGSVAAYRLPYLLVGDSLVLKQESPYYEHFYSQLQPGKHFIPFKRDLSDLTDKILWAMNNDEEAKEIAKNGREFARNFLMPKDIICYYAVALNEWSKRIKGPVEILKSMEKVTHTDTSYHKCTCMRKYSNRAKEEL